MNGKSIKQIATELHISKQALWQRMKRHQQILDMMPEHSYIIKRSVFVDETLEHSIKTLYTMLMVSKMFTMSMLTMLIMLTILSSTLVMT